MQRELSISISESRVSRAYSVGTTAVSVDSIGNTDTPAIITTDANVAVTFGDNPTAVYPTTSADGHAVVPVGSFRIIVPAGKKLSLIAATGTANVIIARGC